MANEEKPPVNVERALKILSAGRSVKPLYPTADTAGLLVSLSKAVQAAQRGGQDNSNQSGGIGEKSHPFDFETATQMTLFNVHHSTCINAKVQAIVGLGHYVEDDEEDTPSPMDPTDPASMVPPKKKHKRKKPSKASLALDPLCKQSWPWLLTLTQVCQDYENVGTGYLEVVRDVASWKVVGLHYLPALKTYKVLENDAQQYHFVHRSAAFSTAGRGENRMAAFGDSERLMRTGPTGAEPLVKVSSRGTVSEVIEFPKVSALSRWYGFPSWLAATASIELVQALNQHQFDFHHNRGVPEFLLFFLGAKLNKEDWSHVEEMMQGHAGLGNSNRSSVLNMTDPAVKIQVERLNMEGIAQSSFFKDMSETLAVAIVTAHQVPPSLAGILLPGKMGAANETSNAIMSFQALVIGPEQTAFQAILGTTLGSPEAGLGLAPEDFEFRTIVQEMADSMEALKPADTMGRMKQSLPAASAEGRDLKEGLKKASDAASDMTSAQARNLIESILLRLLDS